MQYPGSNHRKPVFSLVEHDTGHYWTVILPTQRHKAETRKEALSNLANVIAQIRAGDVELKDVDLKGARKDNHLLGGLRFLNQFASKKLRKKGKK